MTDDVCQCYDNWGSGLSHDTGDCSDRICPFEIAWVDNPNILGQFHKYLECAGKGVCDRTTGECACFPGFEGKGCARATCPNDCSGHGTCEYIEDLGYGATWNDYVDDTSAATIAKGTQSLFSDDTKVFDYPFWDKTKSRKCVCDATYGDLDCSKRLCPYGTDVLDTKDDTYYDYSADAQKYQEQNILLASLTGDYGDLATKTFALTFTSRLNETFTTIPIMIGEVGTDLISFQNAVKLALLNLPNRVIDGVTVTVTLVERSTAPNIEILTKQGTVSLNKYTTSKGAVRSIVGGDALNGEKFTGTDRAVIPGATTASASDLIDTKPLTPGAMNVGYNHRRLSQYQGMSKAASHTPFISIKIRFTGPSVQGPQHLLIVEDYLCGNGCTPKLTGLPLETRQTKPVWSTVVELTKSDYNSFECGRRGKCDYSTGLCQCFAGYIGDNCNTLTTLV